MQDWTETQLALLRPQYEGRWHIWFVRQAVGRQVSWHARRAGELTASIDAASPEELVTLIAEAERA